MNRLRSRKTRRLERLEAKAMMAGDVSVDVVAGALVVLGDDAANQVAIVATETPGEFVVRGLADTNVSLASGSTATVGQPTADGGIVVEGVRRGVVARLAGGDDTLRIQGAAIPGDVLVAGGDGNDTVLVGVAPPSTDPPAADAATSDPTATAAPLSVRGSLRIVTGDGDDVVRVDHIRVGGELSIAVGAGSDRVVIGVPPASSDGATPPAAADATVIAGRGVTVMLGDGDDTATISGAATRGGLVVSSGAGDDVVRLDGVAAGTVLVATGDGADSVAIRGLTARELNVLGGGGADGVRIEDSTLGLLFAQLGAGDDTLALGGVRSRASVLVGGDGEDTLTALAENQLGLSRVLGFETAPAPTTTPSATTVASSPRQRR